MTFDGWIQIALFGVVIVLITKPFGSYMARVFAGERTLPSPVLGPIERLFYRLSGVEEKSVQIELPPMIAVPRHCTSE